MSTLKEKIVGNVKKAVFLWKNTPYTIRNRVKNRLVNVAMYFILFLTLFPIGWMLFSSVKGNDEIMEGKIAVAKAKRDVQFLEQAGDVTWVLTNDGALDKLSSTGKLLVRRTFKTWSTNIISDSKYFWITSADKGLQRVNKQNPRKVKRIALPWPKTLDVNKVSQTLSALDEKSGKLWVTMGYKNFGQIIEVDTATMKIVKTYDLVENFPYSYIKLTISAMKYLDGHLYISTSRGLVDFDLAKGAIAGTYEEERMALEAVKQIIPLVKGELLCVTDAKLYRFDQFSKKMTAIFASQKAGDNINPIGVARVLNDRICVGLSRGFVMLDLNGREVFRTEGPFFYDIDDKGHAVNKGRSVLAEITDITAQSADVYVLGSTVSRLAYFNVKTNTLVERAIIDIPAFTMVRWRNYADLWNNINFGLFLKNSLLISGLTMLFSMLLATITAYALVRFRFPGRTLFSTSILATQMVPGIMFLIPLYIMFVKIYLLTGIPIKGTIAGLVFIYSTFFLPFSVWILRGFFSAIPISLEEAATLDGCTPFQVFWKIAMPLAVPGIVATGVFVFLLAWDELMFAWVLTNEATMTIPVGIRLFVGNFQNRYDLLMAASTVATIPVMILFLALQKHIVSGLTAGAVKQ